MERKTARANAMKLIYEWEMGGAGGEQTRAELLEITELSSDSGLSFMELATRSVMENVSVLDAQISAHLRNWTIERLSRVDLAILRLGTWELLQKQTPAGIVINEAVELAKTYSEERSGAFVNGVLGSISRDLGK